MSKANLAVIDAKIKGYVAAIKPLLAKEIEVSATIDTAVAKHGKDYIAWWKANDTTYGPNSAEARKAKEENTDRLGKLATFLGCDRESPYAINLYGRIKTAVHRADKPSETTPPAKHNPIEALLKEVGKIEKLEKIGARDRAKIEKAIAALKALL